MTKVRSVRTRAPIYRSLSDNSPDSPVYGYDVYVQRLGVYVQYKEHSSALPTDPDIENPYEKEESRKSGHRQRYTPQLDTLDNGRYVNIRFHSTLLTARKKMQSSSLRILTLARYTTLVSLPEETGNQDG